MATSFEQYFQDYAEAFNRFDSLRLASFLHCPCLLVSGASANLLSSAEAIQANTDALLAYHRAQGFAQAVASDVRAQSLGHGLALAGMKWIVERSDGSVLWMFRNTYNLADFGDGWKILVSTTHGDEG